MVIFQWVPFMTKTTTDGVNTYEGLCYDLLNELAARLNFRYEFFRRFPKSNTYNLLKIKLAEIVNFNVIVRLSCSYTLVEPADLQWGGFTNGTYNGMIGQQERKVS